MTRTLSLLILGAGTVLGAAALQAQQAPASPAQPGVGRQSDRGPGTYGGHGGRHGGRGMRGGMRGGRGELMAGRAALRGITLTDAQRTQLRTVADRYRTERRALHDQARAQFRRGTDGQGAGQAVRPDSAARAAFQTRARTLRERQLADVRGVLTADQRVTFDRNVAELRTRAAEYQQRAGRGEGRGLGRGAGRGGDGVR